MIEVQENIHGNAKRLEYAAILLSRFTPASVLDMGCGNGVYLTAPLAERFPAVQFWGTDSDEATVAAAQAFADAVGGLPNLQYSLDAKLPLGKTFDFIIASEVIEHVNEPGEFLLYLRSKLAPGGHALITTPNGYGAFELLTAIETPLHLLGVMRLLSKLPGLRSLKVGTAYDENNVAAMQSDTIAISPHVNFFSYKRLLTLIAEAGFDVVEYRPRSLFGGLGFQQLLRSRQALTWNAYTSDKCSPYLVSGWMFVLKASAHRQPAPRFSYRRRLNERWRKWLTAKRWGTT
jgi:SAM-dependent methyltransferase